MSSLFSGKKVLVTGGSRGIGLAIAEKFLNSGAQVFTTSTKDQGENGKFTNFAVDFTVLSEVKAFAEKISLMDFDVLVNNAGINKINKLLDIKLEDFQSIQDVNVKAPFLITQACAKSMIKNKSGRIVNIASVFGIVSKQERISYTTSKSALIGMTKTLALELAQYNILVNSVSPGFIDTELTRNVLGEAGIKEMTSKVPLKKLGTVEDVAELVLFLSGDQNKFLTGQNLIIDGGFTCE